MPDLAKKSIHRRSSNMAIESGGNMWHNMINGNMPSHLPEMHWSSPWDDSCKEETFRCILIFRTRIASAYLQVSYASFVHGALQASNAEDVVLGAVHLLFRQEVFHADRTFEGRTDSDRLLQLFSFRRFRFQFLFQSNETLEQRSSCKLRARKEYHGHSLFRTRTKPSRPVGFLERGCSGSPSFSPSSCTRTFRL